MNMDTDTARAELRARIRDLNQTTEDATPIKTIHSLIVTGEDEHAHYVLAIMECENTEVDGKTLLSERYVLIAKPDSYKDDTFLKNGIARRDTPGDPELADALTAAYDRVRNYRMNEDGETIAPADTYFVDIGDT